MKNYYLEINHAFILHRRYGSDRIWLTNYSMKDPMYKSEDPFQVQFDVPKGTGEKFIEENWPNLEIRVESEK